MMKNPPLYENAKGEFSSGSIGQTCRFELRNPELRKYIIDVLKFWIRDYDLDGFRCDVAGFVPTDFWETARAEVDKIKRDTIWLAEWESPDLLVKAFDLDYSWANHSAVSDVLFGNKPASEIRRVWEADRAKMPKGALMLFPTITMHAAQ